MQEWVQTQSPTTTNDVVEFPTFVEIMGVIQSTMHKPRPGETTFVIMVFTLLGK